MQEFIFGFGAILVYFVLCALIAIIIRLKFKVHDEVFRKLLHCILLGSLSVWIISFEIWWLVALSAVLFAIVVYPILFFAEKLKGYSKLLTERKKGELKNSLIVVFLMFAVVVAICWGYFGDRLLTLASIYAWGFGDAAAALIGKRYGRHKICGRIINGRKSIEGTTAMFAVSFICVFIVLFIRGGLNIQAYLIISALTGAVSALVELYTPNGLDTITCPIAAMAVILPLVNYFGGGLL